MCEWVRARERERERESVYEYKGSVYVCSGRVSTSVFTRACVCVCAHILVSMCIRVFVCLYVFVCVRVRAFFFHVTLHL